MARALPPDRLRIAMIGTRGVPAAYGGFETAVEEIGQRLVERGHEVTVYCRYVDGPRSQTHRGMKLVYLPALRLKAAETLSHTAFSVLHAAVTTKHDMAFVFNAANAPFVPILRARGIPTAVHVDGLEWMRDKWSGAGRRYYLRAEKLAVKWADALIADAKGIADYYSRKFDVDTELLTYGAPILRGVGTERLGELGLEAGKFHLVVARFEPENHVDVIVKGYSQSAAEYPLVVVGSAPYSAAYTGSIEAMASRDPRVRLLGGLWDQEQLDQLYANALTYGHGHSVGGTNPSLLRAMGGGTPVLAYDVEFNRDVLGDQGMYFSSPDSFQEGIDHAEHHPSQLHGLGQRLQRRAELAYNWDDVAEGYEDLARRLSRGHSIHTSRRLRATEDHSSAIVRGSQR
jgi:glycosyltransferase involved in cell wall biosynthesis